MKVTENIRGYCASAVLPPVKHSVVAPPMPAPGQPSRASKLEAEADSKRELLFLYQFSTEVFERSVLEFHERLIPDTPVDAEDFDEDADEYITIPAPDSKYDIPPLTLRKIGQTAHVAQRLDSTAFNTVQRLIHILFEDTKPYQVTEYALPNDYEVGFSSYVWSDKPFSRKASEEVAGDCSLLFSVMEPWVLSPEDFRIFNEQQTFRNLAPRAGCVPYHFTDSDKLWAMIYDRCQRLKCRWFVVTTYEQFSFGVFSKGWTSGFTTVPRRFDSRGPTVLQCLIYWIASSKNIEGGWMIPEVANEHDDLFRKRPRGDADQEDGEGGDDARPSIRRRTNNNRRSVPGEPRAPAPNLRDIPNPSWTERFSAIARWRGGVMGSGVSNARLIVDELDEVEEVLSQTPGAGPSRASVRAR